MKYCRKCGAKMTDDALFCSKCGCKVIEPKDLDVTEDAAENEQAEGNESANTPDLDLQPVVSQPVKSVSEEKSETKSSYGRTRVQYSTPSNTPPLLDELSSMYKNISRSSLILSIVDMIGTIDWILLGIAFVSWDRLLIPGILFIIYGVGMWVAAVMNFKEYLKARKVSNQLHTDPPQTLGEVIDTFRYEAENEKLFRSLSTVDTVNIFFRFYNVGKYMIKYRCINDYLSENKDSLDIILKAYSQKSVQSNNPDEELRKQKEAFSVWPKTDYQKKLKIRIRAIIVGIILIILIPVLIVLNKSMRDPEYAKYIGEKYGHTNTATQQTTKLQSYTAEEFINRYNELASNSGGKVEKFDFSKATKESDAYGVPYYCIVNDNLDKSIILVLDGNDYSGIVKRIRVNYLIPKRQASVYPYEIANSITVFINDMSLLDACSICEQTMKQKKYTPPSISGITLQYEKDDINDREKWLIQLSNFDSTTVQPSNQTDTKTEENSKVSEKETSTVQESEDSQYYETSERLDSEQSSENEPIEEDPRILKEGKENAEKMLNKNYDKNNYAPEQQKEIESIIEKYMKLINNASSSSEINRLYSVALNQIKNVKTNIPQKIYDKIIEMINDLKEEGKTDITYSFGNIKNADNLFLFIQYCDPYDSEYYYNVNEIDFQYGYCAERSIKFGPAFDGATTISSAHALTIDDENQVGYYYLYPSGRYDYGKILSSTVYNGLIFTSDLSDGTIHYQSDPIPSFPGKYLEFVSVNDLTLLKKMILGETDSASETNTTNDAAHSVATSTKNAAFISTGVHYTVGLKKNGTVVAVGNNKQGQCNVSDWNNIIAVSAGAEHTVGLKKDGTVVAVGSNDFGQCDVSQWKDIIAVSAGDYRTVGLKKDGTVVAVGYNSDGECDVSGWKNIIAVSADCGHTVGLKKDGTVVAVGENLNGQCNVSDLNNIIAVSSGGCHTVGLKNDGTVVVVGNDYIQRSVSDWKDIIAVSAEFHTVGLKKDGTVVAVGDNSYGQCNVSDWKNIIAVSAGSYYTVGLKKDGTVVAVGKNDSCQCNVSDWVLKTEQ